MISTGYIPKSEHSRHPALGGGCFCVVRHAGPSSRSNKRFQREGQE